MLTRSVKLGRLAGTKRDEGSWELEEGASEDEER